MLMDLARGWAVDLSASVIIGDSWRDVEAGKRAGCYTILLETASEANAYGADYVASSLSDAVAHIESGRPWLHEPSGRQP
jgi:D-glycero-D-manno-heptose 1,7-bisphosphate phosphatase